MFRHLDRHAEPVIHFRYKIYDQEGIETEITDQERVFFDRCVDIRFQNPNIRKYEVTFFLV